MYGTDTMFFIEKYQVPKERHKYVTYGCILVDYQPPKKEPHRTRLTKGGALIFYAEDFSTPTADITKARLIIESNIFTPGSRYMCCDINKFYLVTPTSRYEYIKIPIEILPEEIILEYNLINLAHNGYVYCEIWKGIYAPPQAGILANQQQV